MRPPVFLHNPKAGRPNPDLLPTLNAQFPDAELVALDDSTSLAPLVHDRAWVGVAGGDGTVEAVAAALVDTPTALGVVPTGTYNNFARSLGLPADLAAACAVIHSGHVRPIDVGFANGRPFFECLGAGLDAALYPYGEEIKSGRFHRWVDLLRKAYRYPRETFTLTLDRPVCQALARGTDNESHRLVHGLRRKSGRSITLRALMLTVSNGPFFGMNFHVAPEERLDDGLVTVTVFSRYSKWQLWWHFLSVAFGRKRYCPKAVALRVQSLEISGPCPLPVHLDGTPQKGLWPLSITCRHGALQVFHP